MKQVPQRILFLCSHNAARSQMAEGLLRHLGHGQFAAFSAGTEATQVRPEAIAVMASWVLIFQSRHQRRWIASRLSPLMR